MIPLLVLSIVERIEPDDTDREAYKAWCVDHGRCVQRGCRNAPASESDLCEPHWKAHRVSNARHMQFKRKQLGLPLIHISDTE